MKYTPKLWEKVMVGWEVMVMVWNEARTGLTDCCPKMVMLKVLQQYYNATSDDRLLVLQYYR